MLVLAERMRLSNRLTVFWMSTALAFAVGCSINPQPEPPGLNIPAGNGNAGEGGATSVTGAPGGGYNVGSGGMQSSGAGGAANLSTGGASNDSAGSDGGLRGDASSAGDSGDVVDASGS